MQSVQLQIRLQPVVEILSRSTSRKDRLVKRLKFEKEGVGEYWIIDPHHRTVEVYSLNGEGRYGSPAAYGEGDPVPVGLFPDFTVFVDDLFA